MNGRFIFGVLLLVLGLVVNAICLLDLALYLMYGFEWTLSQHIADSVPHTPAAMGVMCSGCFVAGMLATHFTGFRMAPKGK